MNSLMSIIEACLLVAEKPLALAELQAVFEAHEQPEIEEIETALKQLEQLYEERPMALVKVATGYRLQVRKLYAPWVARLFEEKPGRLSKALLETLAIIVYRQPLTRGDVEAVRGVAVSSQIMRTLTEREWVKVIGHKEVPGRPAIYATTRQFLDYFGLRSLEDLPPLEQIAENQVPEFPSELSEIFSHSDNVVPLKPAAEKKH